MPNKIPAIDGHDITNVLEQFEDIPVPATTIALL